MDLTTAGLIMYLGSTARPWKRKEIAPTRLDRLPFLVKAFVAIGWTALVIWLCSLWLSP